MVNKRFLSAIILLLVILSGMPGEIFSQGTVSGPACVVKAVPYQYNVAGNLDISVPMTCYVSNGIISQAQGSNVTGTGTNSISGNKISVIFVIWTSPTNGSIQVDYGGSSSLLSTTISNPVNGGSITSGDQSISYNTTPSPLICTAASIGSCFNNPNYAYDWQQSTDNNSWTSMGISTQNLTFPNPLLADAFFRRRTTESTSSTVAYSNSVKVSVAIPFSTTTISPATQDIYSGSTPTVISGPAATGGNCAGSYSYQWQYSTDGGVTFNPVATGTGANTISYTPAALTATTYFRRKDVCGGAYSFSNAVVVKVHAHLVAGVVSPAGPITLTYNTSPGTLTTTLATGGICTFITHQWQQSLDGVNFTNIGSPTYSTVYSIGNLVATTYYRCQYSCGETVNSNVVRINVNPQVIPGTIYPENISISYNSSPGPITATPASGGNCANSFNYQWQQSPDGQAATFTNISGATGASYTAPALTATTWYRRKVTCGTDVLYTNAVSVNVPTTANAYNFIQTRTITKPNVLDETSAALLTDPFDVKQTTQYFDALGRPLQTVSRQASPLLNDLVVPNVYDAFGRETIKYMPYVSAQNDGKFKANAISDQNTFNSGLFPNEQFFFSRTDYEASPLNVPLASYAPGSNWNGSNRGITMKYWGNTATDAVKVFNITQAGPGYNLSGFSSALPYNAGALTKTVTTDENNKQVEEFKDLQGRVILKKVQLSAAADNGSGSGFSGWLSTYYIYDDFGNLRFVMPPKAVELFNGGTDLASIADELCFRYEYDTRNRMIIKKVPGAGEVYMVYDQRDRLVFTQDANMRINSQWMATLYDGLNRPNMTGMISYAGTRDALQTDVINNTGTGASSSMTTSIPIIADLAVGQREIGKTGYVATNSVSIVDGFSSETNAEFTVSIGGTPAVQNTTVVDRYLPAGNNFTALTITYYDNYDWTTKAFDNTENSRLLPGSNRYAEALPANVSAQQAAVTRGMVTGARVRVIENPAALANGTMLATTTFYDVKGRPIQSHSENYKGGVDFTTIQYDFSGKALSSYILHNNPGAAIAKLGILTSIEYDAGERVLNIQKTDFSNDLASHSTTTTIAKNEYNELGQLKTKMLEPAYKSNAGLEKQDFEYNIRGWLLGMNRGYARDDDNNENHHFGFDLGYDRTDNHLIGGKQYAAAQYNGNIAGMVWKAAGDREKRKYDFAYDAANRLLSADFKQYTGGDFNTSAGLNFSVNNLEYDANGNIKRMEQMGWKITGSSLIDQLTYTYQPNSNKLQNVKDGVNDPATTMGDFKTSLLHPKSSVKQSAVSSQDLIAITDYVYDGNGNLVKDLNKDIGSDNANGIVYNHLNLPWQITFKNATGDKGTITYVYDAAGNKLSKKVNEYASTVNNNKASSTATDYLGAFVYENNKLQFVLHEEGKMRVTANASPSGNCWFVPSPEICTLNQDGSVTCQPGQPVPGSGCGNPAVQYYYFANDFFIKDHLGNVRSVLTDESRADAYPMASMETSNAATENNYYSKIEETRAAISSISGYPNSDNTTNPNANTARVNGSGNKIGPGITLKVMAGDKFNVRVNTWYKSNGANLSSPVSPLNDLIAALALGFGGIPGSHATATQLQDGAILTSGINSFFTKQNTNTTGGRPKAYLNWILFDEQFKFVQSSSSAEQVPDESAFGVAPNQTVYPIVKTDLPIDKNGYLYVYVSNETPNIDVFFDNLQVTHNRGSIKEENHYYPFGLQIPGISSKALGFGGNENRYKYNGKEEQNKEFSDGGGLEEYDYGARNYDSQIGMWHNPDAHADNSRKWSQYSYAFDNPIRFVDPDGMDVENYSGDAAQAAFKQLQQEVHNKEAQEATRSNRDYESNFAAQYIGTAAYDESNKIGNGDGEEKQQKQDKADIDNSDGGPQTWYYMYRVNGNAHAMVYDPVTLTVYEINSPKDENGKEIPKYKSILKGEPLAFAYKYSKTNTTEWDVLAKREAGNTYALCPINVPNPAAATKWFDSHTGKPYWYNCGFNNCSIYVMDGLEKGGAKIYHVNGNPAPSSVNSKPTLYWVFPKKP